MTQDNLPMAPTTIVEAATEQIGDLAALLQAICDAIPVPDETGTPKAGQQIYARVYLNSTIRSLQDAKHALERFKIAMNSWGVEFVSELMETDGVQE